MMSTRCQGVPPEEEAQLNHNQGNSQKTISGKFEITDNDSYQRQHAKQDSASRQGDTFILLGISPVHASLFIFAAVGL